MNRFKQVNVVGEGIPILVGSLGPGPGGVDVLN